MNLTSGFKKYFPYSRMRDKFIFHRSVEKFRVTLSIYTLLLNPSYVLTNRVCKMETPT